MFRKTLLKKIGLYVPLRDAWLRIRRHDQWKQKQAQLHFYSHLIPKGSLCFDIGANVGDYTELLLPAGARRVVAVEPQSLKKGVKLKGVKLGNAVRFTCPSSPCPSPASLVSSVARDRGGWTGVLACWRCGSPTPGPRTACLV
jgi:hypothetical protein